MLHQRADVLGEVQSQEFDRDFGAGAVERLDHGGGELGGPVAHDADPQRGFGCDLGHVRDRGVDRRQQGPRVPDEPLTGRGEPDGGAVQQPGPEFVLQLLDVRRDGSR